MTSLPMRWVKARYEYMGHTYKWHMALDQIMNQGGGLQNERVMEFADNDAVIGALQGDRRVAHFPPLRFPPNDYTPRSGPRNGGEHGRSD